jgi:predicted metal-dependent phosphoesterase TrpH
MLKADLHLHSNKSDGILSPEEVVLQAAKLGLAAISLTDHDTVEGISEALDAGTRYGVRVVPGIELNTSADNGELHILGYYICHTDTKLLDTLKGIKEARVQRVRTIIKKLNDLGFEITFDQVLKKAGKADSMGRPHIARLLLEKGYVSTVKEAFEKYIGYGGSAYVERHKLLPREVIALIKDCGGVPVLAHPGILSSSLYIDLCIREGVQGIEVYHSRHTEEQAAVFRKIARRHDLIVTGGSDCHGEFKFDGKMLMGRYTVDAGAVDRLKEAAAGNGVCMQDMYNHCKA